MALSPDVIFELFLPSQPSADEAATIVGSVQRNLPGSFQKSENVWNNNNNVLTIGLWIAQDGFTDAQLQDSLRASSFISSGMTADLFVSAAVIRLAADQAWATAQKRIPQTIGFVTLNDKINVDVSSAGIVSEVDGAYHPRVLPKIDLSYTIKDSLTIDQSGVLKPNESTDLHLSTLGVIEESVLTGLLNQFLGAVVFISGGVLERDPHAGVGAQLANNWPTVILTPTSPPLTGKVIFTWSKVNVDNSGVSTLGTWNLALRSPQVRIAGRTTLSFPNTNPSVSSTYRVVDFTDLEREGATVVWSGKAEGGGLTTTVEFDSPGTFSIQARVTDVDNVSATAATSVTVTETQGHGEPL
jgi:hypothetical protein